MVAPGHVIGVFRTGPGLSVFRFLIRPGLTPGAGRCTLLGSYMALFTTSCSICLEKLQPGEPTFSTWGVWLPEGHPLLGFCDSVMHWECYASWPGRSEFARSYFRFWADQESSSGYWHRAYCDEDVLVTVNPDLGECDVYLATTGTCHRVDTAKWESWLLEDRDRAPHQIVASALEEVVQRLRAALPNATALVGAIDLGAKAEVMSRHAQEEKLERAAAKRRYYRRQLGKQAHNAACQRLADAAQQEGLECPLCKETTSALDVVKLKKKWLALRCLACNGDFEPGDFQPDPWTRSDD